MRSLTGYKTEGAQIIVDLENQKVIAGELEYPFSVDTFRRHCDDERPRQSIGLTYSTTT